MAEAGSEVNARIVYWGIEGAGVSANLRTIHAKLRSDHRGELREVPTRLDPTVSYEVLPIELGAVGGVRTRIQIVGVPGGPEQAPTRKQLLDRVDGLVLVVDAQDGRIEENVATFEELRQCLAAYGRALRDLPVVVQYNKRDLANPYAIEELHRKLDLPGAAVFETVANEGGGVLQTLTTISKRVIRVMRERGDAPAPAMAAPAVESETAARPEPAARLMETAILAEAGPQEAVEGAAEAALAAEEALHQPWDAVARDAARSDGMRIGEDLRIVSVTRAERVGRRAIRVSLVLGDGDGETVPMALTIQLDPLLDVE